MEKGAKDIDRIYGLDQGYGLIVENGDHSLKLISFVYLDFHSKVFQKLDKVEYRCNSLYVKVNKEEPTEFVVNLWDNNDISVQVCKINKTKIIAGELIGLDFECKCYSGKCIYGVDLIWNEEFETVSFTFESI